MKEIQSLSEEVERLTVDPEPTMSINQPQSRRELEAEMMVENEKLKDMKEHVYEMMEDYTVDDVRQGNVELVDRELKDIANSRSEFRNAIKE